MEKKKALKTVKLTFVIFYLVIFVGLFLLQVWAELPGLVVSFESLIYWWFLVGWVFLIINFKWSSSASLIPAFLLFILGAFFATVGFREVAETTMRISFIGWLVGIVQALVEYKTLVEYKKGKMKRFKFLILFFPVVVVFWQFFLPGLRVAGDFPYASVEMVKVGFNVPQLWSFRTAEGLGEYVVGTLWSWPIDFFYSLGGVWGINFSVLERILGIFPFLVLTFWGTRRLFSYFKVSGLGKWVGILFYAINTYILLIIDGGQLSIALAYAWMPTAFLTVEKSIKGDLRNKVLAGLSVTLLGVFDIRFVYVLAILLALRFLWQFLLGAKAKKFFLLKKWITSALIAGTVFLLLNFYWILPAVLSQKPPLPTTYLRTSQVDFLSFAELKHSLFLLSPHWYKNVFGNVTPFREEFLAIPILAFLALLLRREKEVWFWGMVAAVGVFLVKGANPPLPKVYPWLFANIPGFFLFRDPTKFFFLVALSYSLLIGVTVEEVSKRFKKLTIISFLFPILTTSYFVFLARPAYTGRMTGTFSEPVYKEEFLKIANILQNDKDFGRVFWIPTRAPLGYSSPTHPSVEAAGLVQKRPFAVGTVGTYEIFNFLREAPFMGQLFDIAAIKYIVYPFPDTRREDLKEDNIDYYYAFLDQLSNLSWIRRRISNPPVAALETKGGKKHFFIIPNTWWVVGSDRIYWNFAESQLNLLDNALVFVEEKLGLGRELDEVPHAKVILYDKQLLDFAVTLLEPEHFIFPAEDLKFDPDETGWWKREAADFIWWRNFLQKKYGLDNLDFDYGGGWAIGEGEKAKDLLVKDMRLKKGNILLARVMLSSRGGRIKFYQGEKLIGSINTKIKTPQKVKIKLTGYGKIPDQIFEYDKAQFLWFEVGILAFDRQPLTIKTEGDINVVNALVSVSPLSLQKVQDKVEDLKSQGVIFDWKNLSVQEKKTLFDGKARAKIASQRISPTHYKVEISGLSHPATLAFSETYDSFWIANKKRAYPIYSLINGFQVEKDGEYEIVFLAQRYIVPGIWISGLSLSFISIYLLIITYQKWKGKRI